jgi:hypothetical protein
MEMDGLKPDLRIPMEHPLFSPPVPLDLDARFDEIDVNDLDDGVLFNQVVVDRAKLSKNIRRALQNSGQISLAEVLKEHPLEEGLAELVAYLSIGENSRTALVDDKEKEEILWTDREGVVRKAMFPRIVFNRM